MGNKGSSDPGGYGRSAANLYNTLAGLAQQQWDVWQPGVANYVQQQQWQSGMAQQLVPWLAQAFVNRYSGGPNVRYVTPGLQSESVAQAGGAGTALDQAMDVASGGTGLSGKRTPLPPYVANPYSPTNPVATGGGKAGWVAQNTQPTPPPTPPTPPPAPTPTPNAGPTIPQFNLPNLGGFDTSAYDMERGLWERVRTDLEQQQSLAMSGLQRQLGQRFGISGAAAPLAAGAAAELAGMMNSQAIDARTNIAQYMDARRQQDLAGLAGIIMPMMGLDSGGITYGTMNAANAMGQAAQGLTGLAQWRQQQQQNALSGWMGLGTLIGSL